MSRWFRHYAGLCRDDKLVRAAIKSGQPVERAVWVWAAILESAAETNDDGRFELDPAEIAYFLRADADDIIRLLGALEEGGRISGGRVVHWSDRQFQSDRSAGRQQRYRDRQKASRDGENMGRPASCDSNGDFIVTAASRHGDAPETETETETEKKQDIPPPQASGGGDEPRLKPPKAKATPEPKDDDEIPASLDRRTYPEEFEALWLDYRPVASPNSTKADACKAFMRLPAEERAACRDGLKRYVAWLAEEKQRRDGTKVKHLETFISKRGWEPFLESAASVAAVQPMPWVHSDTPEWVPCARRYETENGKPPPLDKNGGWRFPADWPETRAH